MRFLDILDDEFIMLLNKQAQMCAERCETRMSLSNIFFSFSIILKTHENPENS